MKKDEAATMNDTTTGTGLVFSHDMQRYRIGLQGDFEALIGSDPGCRVCISGVPGVAAQHAVLKRAGDRLFVRDLGSPAGTYLNDERLRAGIWAEVGPGDQLALCNISIRLTRELFHGRERLGLETSPLTYVLPHSHRVLCNGIQLRAMPGTITAVLGPSGSGKTTLLNLLNGCLRPTKGRVIIGRRYDVHQEYPSVQELLGYVPQEDLMIPELTVRESLDYRLRLRFPDMAPAVRCRVIRETCTRLGFEESKLGEFLDTQIGSAESGCRGLSGGERKRANIAHELVIQPLVLLLDEPTTGLPCTDAEQIVRLLHDLARKDNLTIILTAHQPSREVFALFDEVLLLAADGRPAYYGRAREAPAHFETLTGIECGSRNPAEYLLWVLGNLRAGEAAGDCGLQIADCATRIEVRNPQSEIRNVPRLVHQWWVLLRRNLRVLWADRPHLGLLFGQVPVIGLLILLAFHGFPQDLGADDHFARTKHCFDLSAEPLRRAGMTVMVDSLWRAADAKARSETRLVGERHAHRRGAIYFLLVASSIWFGLIGACKEVVTEQHILRRESRSGVCLLPYLGAKAVTATLLVGLQTGLLAACVAPLLLGASCGAVLLLWGMLWLAAATAAALGLLVSCAARTHRLAVSAVPLLLVPQLLLGGLMRPHTELAQRSPALGALSDLTLQRWGFEGSLATDPYAGGGVLKQVLPERVDLGRRYAELDALRLVNVPISEVFFASRPAGAAGMPVLLLVGNAGLFLVAAYIVLRWRFAPSPADRGKEVMRRRVPEPMRARA